MKIAGQDKKWESGIFFSFAVWVQNGAKMGVAGGEAILMRNAHKKAPHGPGWPLRGGVKLGECLKFAEHGYNLAHNFCIIAING